MNASCASTDQQAKPNNQKQSIATTLKHIVPWPTFVAQYLQGVRLRVVNSLYFTVAPVSTYLYYKPIGELACAHWQFLFWSIWAYENGDFTTGVYLWSILMECRWNRKTRSQAVARI